MRRPPGPGAILTFWFEEAGPERWFGADAAFDAHIRRRFSAAVETQAQAFRDGAHPWLESMEGALALIILLDQFPRNVWRGSPRAFVFDPLGLAAARKSLDAGFDRQAPEVQRPFFYMPFMHSEDIEDQELCVALCRERLPKGNTTLKHARAHRDIVKQFGRFPYRNDVLGRRSSKEEKVWLAGDGYRPG